MENALNHPDIMLTYHLCVMCVMLESASSLEEALECVAIGDAIKAKIEASPMEITNGEVIEALKKLYLG